VLEVLPYTWSDVSALQATTSSLRADLATVRELASALSGARFGLGNLARASGWSGPVATVHRAQLTGLTKQVQASTDLLATAATTLVKQIGEQEALIRQRQAALMRQDAAVAAAAAAARKA
jgi:hypothetical protein